MVTVVTPTSELNFYDETFNLVWFKGVNNVKVGDVLAHASGDKYFVNRVRRSDMTFLRRPMTFVYVVPVRGV